MDSINKHLIHTRISSVVDGFMASQGQQKTVMKHLKELRKSAGLVDPSAGGMKDFLRDFGGGI